MACEDFNLDFDIREELNVREEQPSAESKDESSDSSDDDKFNSICNQCTNCKSQWHKKVFSLYFIDVVESESCENSLKNTTKNMPKCLQWHTIRLLITTGSRRN